jgi:hypothetical protein
MLLRFSLFYYQLVDLFWIQAETFHQVSKEEPGWKAMVGSETPVANLQGQH